MKILLIVYHSVTGGTQQMAEAAARGAACEAGARVAVLRAAEAGAGDVLNASAYLFASPENLASMSGLMKDFFDRVYYAVLNRINGRPYAAMVCAGNDGRNAVQHIERIAAGWRLRSVAAPLIVHTHAQTPEAILLPKQLSAADLRPCAELGATLAAGTALGIF